MPFLIIFIGIPFIELMVFASVSEHIGIGTALLLAFLTAAIGGMIVRHQGLQTIMTMRGSMDQGKMPLSELFDGFCLVAAGAMLITPGFVTDTIGFLLLVPAVRDILRSIIKTHTNWAAQGATHQTHHQTMQDGNIIEGEFEEIDGE